MIDIVRFVQKKFPNLKRELYAAHISKTPHDYVKRSLKTALLYSVSFIVLFFFIIDSLLLPFWILGVAFPILFVFMLHMQMIIPKVTMRKRIKEIDDDIIFTSRFLLIKLSAGKPLFNALIETSQSYGVSAKYIKELVDDINFGTPIEKALQHATENSPSRHFRKIMFQINIALRIGVDVTKNLESAIEEIEDEQALELTKYSKKLNSAALFYMLIAIIMPSLGMTVLILLLSVLPNFQIDISIYIFLLFCIVMLQLFFISVFRQIRPSVSL